MDKDKSKNKEIDQVILDQEIATDENMNNKSNDDKVLRLAAELENTRSRMMREMDNIKFSSIQQFALDVCRIADSMLCAKTFLNDKSTVSNDSILQGINMVIQSIDSVFKNHGISTIQSLNCKFDPNLHEAIGEEITDKVPNNHVFKEVQLGYILGNKLLRPAKVIVAKQLNTESEKQLDIKNKII